MRDLTPLQVDILEDASMPIPNSIEQIAPYESSAHLAARDELEQLGLLREEVFTVLEDGRTVTIDLPTARGRAALAVHHAIVALGGV